VNFLDYFMAVDWDLAYRMLSEGSVPLVLQLLILNTIFLIAYVIRNATARYHLKRSTVLIIQGLLIGANLAVLLQGDYLPYLRPYTIL